MFVEFMEPFMNDIMQICPLALQHAKMYLLPAPLLLVSPKWVPPHSIIFALNGCKS